MATEMFFPTPMKLSHTRNSRGEFGMFVNPHACSCDTCVDFVAEQREEAASPHTEIAVGPTPTPASLTATTSALMPSSTRLAHTVNSRGELGMYVNPQSCDCHTCVDFLAEHPSISLTTVSPSLPPPPPISERAAAEVLLRLAPPPPHSSLVRHETACDEEEDGIGPTYSMASDPHAQPPFAPSPPTGGLGLFSASHGALSFWTPFPPTQATGVHFTAKHISTLEASLKEYVELLVEQQNELDHSGCSHDEMAAQDAMWDELDRKISEVDEILGVMGCPREE